MASRRPIGPHASARRWAWVRGSWAHTVAANASNRHPWLPRRRHECGGKKRHPRAGRLNIDIAVLGHLGGHPHPGRIELATHASMRSRSLFFDSFIHFSTRAAMASSNARHHLVVDILRTRDDIETTRKSIVPRRNTLATAGNRYLSAHANCTCPTARAWLMFWTADTSAATASQPSAQHHANSANAPDRRSKSSATRQQPLRSGRGLIPSRLTHHSDEIPLRQPLEHTFDTATAHRHELTRLQRASD